MKKFISYTAALTAGLQAMSAHAGPYNFGGSCPSQGAWTQIALQQTQQIADVVKQLKNNPDCKGIESVVGDLQSAASFLAAPESQQNQEAALQTLPMEIGALRTNLIANGSVDKTAADMLMNRTLQAAQVSTQLENTSPSTKLTQAAIGQVSGSAIKALFTRYAAPTKKGMELVSKVFQVLPQYDQCLIGQPQQGLAILSGAVKVAAAFSAAGEGVGDTLGNSIATLTTMLRDRRFTLVLRQLDESQFWFSISCLLESTSKNYCDAQSAQEILQYSKDQYQDALKKNLQSRTEPGYDNPLEGYYILVRELPMISAWLQQVQFGVEPKLLADANFKNKIWDQVTDLTKSVNSLTGYFNEQRLTLRDLPEMTSKRNQLFTMLQALVAKMSGQDEATAGSATFFLQTVDPNLLPFYLIGLDSIPRECMIVKDRPAPPMAWLDWMKMGGANNGVVAQFNDPDKLATVIESRMNEIIAGASQKSSVYFRKRLIMDMPNLVNQTLTGQYMTVHKAFENVYNYLVRFEAKLKKDDMDVILIPSVRETRNKILKFLKSYDKLRTLAKQTVLTETTNTDMQDKVDAAATEVIDTIFMEFNILFQKDTFLTNRLTTYIDHDFAMRIKSGAHMTSQQQDLLVITQKHLLEKLTEVHGVNLNATGSDLAQAQFINRRNIAALEEIFKDSFYKAILQIRSAADGSGQAGVNQKLDQKYNEEKSWFRKMSWYLPSFTPGSQLVTWLMAGPAVRNAHPDLYQDRGNPNRVDISDDKFGSIATVQAQFCAQTLAFVDSGYFYELCKGTTLKSFYSGKEKTKYDLVYNDFMPNASAGLMAKKNPNIMSKNICALNNFTLKSVVKFLQDQDAEMYKDDTFY